MSDPVALSGSVGGNVIHMLLLCGGVIIFALHSGIKALLLSACRWKPVHGYVGDAILLSAVSTASLVGAFIALPFLLDLVPVLGDALQSMYGWFLVIFPICVGCEGSLLQRWAKRNKLRALSVDAQNQMEIIDFPASEFGPWQIALITNMVGIILLGLMFAILVGLITV